MSSNPGTYDSGTINSVSALFAGDRSFAEGLRLGSESVPLTEVAAGTPEDFSFAVGEVVGVFAARAGVAVETLVSAEQPHRPGLGGLSTPAEIGVVAGLLEDGESSSPATRHMAKTLRQALRVMASFGPGEASEGHEPVDMLACQAQAERLGHLAEFRAMRQPAGFVDDLTPWLE